MSEEKVTTMKLKIDLHCCKCYKKVKKVLCKIPQIREQAFDEKQGIVTIKVVCCDPERLKDKLFCKGEGCIISIEIVKPPPPKPPPKPSPPPPPPPVQVDVSVGPFYQEIVCGGGRPCYVNCCCQYYCDGNPQGCTVM